MRLVLTDEERNVLFTALSEEVEMKVEDVSDSDFDKEVEFLSGILASSSDEYWQPEDEYYERVVETVHKYKTLFESIESKIKQQTITGVLHIDIKDAFTS